MSPRRALAWVLAIGASALNYVVSVILSGAFTHNGAWVLMVIVFALAAGDVIRLAKRSGSR